MGGKALADFDGIAYGLNCLTFAKNAGLITLSADGNDRGWVWGTLMASQSGWCPSTHLRPCELDIQLRDTGCLDLCEVLEDFDGAPHGSDYLTLVRGTKIARLRHEGVCKSWTLGVVVVLPGGWFPRVFVQQLEH